VLSFRLSVQAGARMSYYMKDAVFTAVASLRIKPIVNKLNRCVMRDDANDADQIHLVATRY